MAEFKFTPRAILELGKELISSDEVALYELIKNGVDAGSSIIEIVASVVLPASEYRLAQEKLQSGDHVDDVLNAIESKLYVGAPNEARDRFRDQIRGATGRPKEFSKALHEAYQEHNWLEVRDWGHGMSLRELDQFYLTVGTRSRRAENVSGAKYLGDKGVGRLSTMRLGEFLQVRTTTKEATHWHILDIDWSRFSHDTNESLSQITVDPRNGPPKPDKDFQGTIIRVSQLTSDWSAGRFQGMFDGNIARMVDPFEPGKANRLLRVWWNGSRVLVPSIPKTLLEAAHAVCNVRFDFKRDEPQLNGEIEYRTKHKSQKVAVSGAEIYSIAQRDLKKRGKKGHAANEFVPISPAALKELGPFSIEIYWFNRRVVEAIAGLTDKATQTKQLIQQWAGGPMLYRHGFRILPYGDPDNDWLELDKKAFGQPGFKLNRQQVIGRVTINASHMALSEQTNREGLVEFDASEALTTILTWLVHVELRGFINKVDALDVAPKRQGDTALERVREAEDQVDDALQNLRRAVGPDHKKQVEHLRETVAGLVSACEALMEGQSKTLKETLSEREKFVHLAGIGLITEFIFHELDRALNHTLRMLPEAKGSRRDDVLTNLEDQLKTLQKRVSAFDELTGEKRQTKSIFDLGEVVESVLATHANQFERHHIEIEFDAPELPYRVRAVRGMVIQILENLIVNAVYWLKQQTRYERGFKPQISIDLDDETHSLTVEDNGGGIDPSRREHIFEPFVSTKPPADHGRGLGLFIARELAEYNGWELYLDEEVGRMRAGRLSLFVLDMDDGK